MFTTPMREYLLKECFEVAKTAWELDESNEIIVDVFEIRIRYNFKNLKRCIEYSILFL